LIYLNLYKKETLFCFYIWVGGGVTPAVTWINTTGIYMFTNRNGKNTRNLAFYQFTEELRQGKAEVVVDTPLMDRAMNSLMKGLRS